ncbi:hypothetical protein BRC72_07840 [Halobacteriales archaeon QH_7_66_36]|jgi:hypothetical protein|nr:MAG: hypothetical protein BRC72_07840 [Halobacteriales archaeon QH_7_66_36]
MDRDRSLDEFLGDADEGSPNPDDASDADATDEDEPTLATTTYDSDGADCEACGATVTRRWRDGDALVCGECKEW